MTSPFAAAANAAAAASDYLLGETFEYRPMKAAADVNAPKGVDADRPVTSLLAVFGEPSARFESGARRTPGVDADRGAFASARPFISFALSRLPYAPRDGDHVLRTDTGEIFRVAEVLPSTPGFVRLDLNLVKGTA